MATDALESVGLADRLHHKPNELSGGQRQRVAIARALVNKPSIILADEPTGNLDSTNSQLVMRNLVEICESHMITLIVVSHDNDVINKMRNKKTMIDGKLI